jgi:aspartate carbamoyltransferase catalytic subunit
MTPKLRHITSINDLSNDEIEHIFAIASRYLEQLGAKELKHRIAKSLKVGAGTILGTLFYEPSTRTRLSFESAMLRLGGSTISSSDPTTSSTAKGETLADTVRVASSYADALVVRHPRDGAAKLAAEYAEVPVVNGGDGSHEHPTQTLCDLFTLQHEHGRLKGLNVVISGDLKGSRTIHSFVYALARFGANIMLMPGAKGMALPAHVDWRLRNEFRCMPVPREKYERENADVDALYVTAEEPHQLSLMAGSDIEAGTQVKLRKTVDVFYVTRFQKERWAEHNPDYLKVDAKFLRNKKYKRTSVLHPLPRVGELDVNLDKSSKAAYFRQAAYGVPIRMALLAALLEFERAFPLERFTGGFRQSRFPQHLQSREFGLTCPNKNCIANDAHDGKSASNRFLIVQRPEFRLRCHYCETDIEHVVAGNRRTKHYDHHLRTRGTEPGRRLKDLIFFPTASEAEKHGYQPYRKSQSAAE